MNLSKNRKFDINNYDDFEKIVDNIRNGRIPFIGENYTEIYRGQSKDSYELKPNITRNISNKENLFELEKKILEEFKKNLRENELTEKYIQLSKNSNDYENEWRWIEQAQHYRLPTRLLDWTIKPEIALFFAVENNFDDIGQFWIYKTPLNWSCNDHFEINPKSEKLNLISNSSFYIESDYVNKIAEQRRSFQDGKFSFQDYDNSLIPLNKQGNLQEIIIKYTINPSSKKDLLIKLNEQNINKNSVYVKYDIEIEKIIENIKSNL